jgi:hypothetical protein
MNNNKSDRTPLFICGSLILLVLWQMLLPGYIFGLDQIVSPFSEPTFFLDGFYNRLPQYAIQWLLYLILPGWFAQKIVIVSLFLALVFLPYRFLPIPDSRAKFWAAIFYFINPFVYVRFLTGQLDVLFSYAFLPPFIFYLIEFWRDGKQKNIWLAFFWLLIIGAFSIHLLFMTGLILIGVSVIAIAQQGNKIKTKLKPFLLTAAIFLMTSSYWLVPFFLKSTTPLNTITAKHAAAFMTTSDPRLGTILNVLALHGFWAENDHWADYFIWPKDNFWFWLPIWLLSLALVSTGIYRSIIKSTNRTYALTILIIAIGALIFSCGVADSPFQSLNKWLFEHVNFWRGFRDTTKWSALIALAYAYFGAFGVLSLANTTQKYLSENWNKFLVSSFFVLPLIFTYPMLGGFMRQIQPVWYPTSWYEAKKIVETLPPDSKILALPWHQYLSLPFNRYQISANPLKLFFGDRVIQSENMELSDVTGLLPNSLPEKINFLLTDKSLSPTETLIKLQTLDVNHVLVLNELLEPDPLKYPWLAEPNLKLLYSSKEINLYLLPSFQ